MWRTWILALSALAFVASGCNQFELFGTKKDEPPDTQPPGWDPGYGNDQFFYFWRVVQDQTGEEKGVIYRKNIHNNDVPEPFWISPSGKCVGCHSVSPDGKYMTVVELTFRLGLDPTVHVVDIENQTEVQMPQGPLAGTFTSWNPDPNTDPPHQFVMASPYGLQIASPTTGVIQTLQATASPGVSTMPSWGPDGRIVYAHGEYGDPRLILYEESELWTIKPDGTDPQLLLSVPGKLNYFPDWNPLGRWIAFTQSPPNTNSGTIANPNGNIFIYDLQDHVVINPDDLNDAISGGKSWPTWSEKGNRLTCGTTEDEGRDSDIYITNFDPDSGLDWDAGRIDIISTERFEHIPRWAP